MAVALGPSRGLRSEINVTPLVDVVLVLLIIFMVVTPVLQRGKEVNLPAARGADEEKEKTDQLVVSVTRDRRVWIENESYAVSGVATEVSHRVKVDPNARILLKGDRDLTVGDVRRVLRAIREGGAKDIALAVKEQVAKR